MIDFTDTPVSPHRLAMPVRQGFGGVEPMVTVVTPVLNAGETLLETALSLLRQTYPYFRWILVDDGSSNRSGLIALQQLVGGDDRVQFHTLSENRGPSAARNAGIRLVETPFVFFLDADDLIEPTAIEKMLWFLLAYPEATFASAWEVGFQGNQYLNNGGFDLKERFREENLNNITTLVRREVFEHTRFDESNREGLEDWEFWISLADRGLWGGCVREYLIWYRWSYDWREKWQNWRNPSRRDSFREALRGRYPRAFRDPFPDVRALTRNGPVVLENPLQPISGHSLTIYRSEPVTLPLSTGTIVFTFSPSESLLAQARSVTSDYFVLPSFLPESLSDAFLDYLLKSRSAGSFEGR